MAKLKQTEMVSRRFGKLIVMAQAENTSAHDYRWLCKCDCGNDKIAYGYSLLTGKTDSCGCLKGARVTASKTRHGDSHCKEHQTWAGMKNRCYNVNEPKFKDYGARGIIVCERWLHSYENFLQDIGRAPHKKMTLDRIDNDGNYEPSNCRWATNGVQANNKSTNHYLTYGDKRMSMADWARELNLKHSKLEWLITKNKFTIEEVVKGKRGVTWEHLISYNGDTLNLSQWAKKLNMSATSFRRGKYRDMPKEKVVEIFYKKNIPIELQQST